MSNENKNRILIVDDEESIREFLDLLFTKEKFSVTACDSAIAAFGLAKENKFDLIFLDIQMPHISGLEALIRLKKLAPGTEIIIITAYGTTENAVEAMRSGAYDFITKPFKVDHLINLTQKALEKRNITRESQTLQSNLVEKYSYSDFVGSSPSMIALYEMVRIVSKTTSNILITGESGTGKELIARAIHYNGPLKDKPFVIVNCGAIQENLIESEMFGHKKGSFTGAIADKVGLFETANHGTIFLDEVGELPIHLQVKLLRALQERTIRRIGDTDDIHIDIRIITATNQNLHEMVAKGLFREDLYYRLNVIQIQAPPLRERGDDIIMLSNHFAEKYSKKLDKQIDFITQDAFSALKIYPFPGNVRELENIIERAVALSTDSKIKLADLPPNIYNISRAQGGIKKTGSHNISIPEGGIELEKIIDDIEKDLLNKALNKTGGVKKRAAKLLGISFRSMRYRLEKYGMD
ncbi:MAG: sigma-54-dependent Fis family transcriptional regulator [Oligoflexia bacterium]|nr:sigma-54-dependent Fis family transcriptional regulator [Oligoflexia bacterium]